MPNKAYPQRYAKAVFELALESGQLERWQEDLDKLAAVISDERFRALMENPKITADEKTRLIAEHLGEGNPLALNLARLLISRMSIGIAGQIAAAYRTLLDDHYGRVQADVVTAVPLDETDRQKLAASLGGVMGKQVEIQATVEPDILGGIVARVGGKLLDGSTRSRLERLKRQLASGEKRR